MGGSEFSSGSRILAVIRMRYVPHEALVALIDKAWFDFLAARADGGHLDEVNFRQPKAMAPMRKMLPGEPIFGSP